MNIEKINSKNSTSMVAKATFGTDEIKEGFKKIYNLDKARVKIPGFRPGKAPYSLFKAHVGLDYLKEEFIYNSSRQALREILDEKSFKMVGNPEVSVETFEVDDKCILSFEIQFIPDFELPDVEKLKIKIGSFKVTDKDINSTIDRLRLQHATMTPIDRPTKEKDFVYFKWSVVTDGKVSGRWKEELVEVGREDFVSGFDKNLIGVKTGETKRVKTKISGEEKPVEIEIQIGETKTAEMPELNDEFAKMLSIESIDALKSAIKAELEVSAKKAKEQEIHNKLAERLLEKTKLEIPDKLISASIDDEIYRLKDELVRKGLTFETYLTKRDISEEKLREELTPRATGQAKIDLILEEFATKENIEPDDSEIEVELEKYNTATRNMKKSQRIDEETLKNNISSAIKRRKTLEFLLGKAGLKEE
jgi:trigger factor